MLLSWDKIEILNAPSSVLVENSDLALAAGEGTGVLSVIISPWFRHCLICELAHSCTELDQTLQLCRINFCFLFIFTRPASALPGWLTEYKSVWQSLPRHMWRLSAFGAGLGVSEAKKQSLQGLEHLEHTVHRGLAAHCSLLLSGR